jgi:hypothetical protein
MTHQNEHDRVDTSPLGGEKRCRQQIAEEYQAREAERLADAEREEQKREAERQHQANQRRSATIGGLIARLARKGKSTR